MERHHLCNVDAVNVGQHVQIGLVCKVVVVVLVKMDVLVVVVPKNEIHTTIAVDVFSASVAILTWQGMAEGCLMKDETSGN